MNDCLNCNCKFNFEGECQLMLVKIDSCGNCKSKELSEDEAIQYYVSCEKSAG